MLGSAIASSKKLLENFVISLLVVGSVLAFYGLMQWRGLDIFDYSNAYSSNVFGTFGNPNFQSAFMGMVAAAASTAIFFGRYSNKIRGSLVVLIAIAILNVKLSSLQGYLNFLAGFSAALILYLFSTRRKIMGWFVLGIASAGSTVLILGIFNLGPLSDYIYKSSLQARGFYWRAAVKMMVEHPIFGVGLDSFGNWFRRSRSRSASEFNAGVVSDTAHNIPLDLGTGGGFPLLIAYMCLVLLTIISITRILKRGQEFNVVFATLVAAWVAYQAQSLISINQLGLGVWGWSLSGLLIGYEINSRDQMQYPLQKIANRKSQGDHKIPASTLLIAVMSGVIGLIVSIPPYLAANKFYSALQSGDGIVLQQAAYLKPYDRTRFLYTAQILAENSLDKNAIHVLSDAAKIYPDSFELWQRWSQIPTASPAEIAKAKSEMKRLDPLNPDLK
jgi:hypothetical protein